MPQTLDCAHSRWAAFCAVWQKNPGITHQQQENVMTTYASAIEHVRAVKAKLGGTWGAIHPEDAARMIVQNRFRTGLDIAKYTAAIMRRRRPAPAQPP